MTNVVCGIHVEEDFDAVNDEVDEDEDPIVTFFPNQPEIVRRQRKKHYCCAVFF